MALIKCPECGKEISDKAAACINCGCPVSAIKANNTKPAENAANLGNIFAQFFSNQAAVKTAPVKTVPTELPDMKLLPGIIVAILDKLCGLAGLAGFMGLGSIIIGILEGNFEEKAIKYAIIGFAISYISVCLIHLMNFRHAKKFLQQNGYEDSIRNDSPALTNSLNAFNLCNYVIMARHIKKLNPTAGNALEMAIKQEKTKKRKMRLSTLPYLAVLLIAYYIFPRFEEMLRLPYESSLIICHIITAVVMVAYSYKKAATLNLVVAVALLFVPTIFAYYYSDIWYHILICAAAAFLGMALGSALRKKNNR